jgi:DNA repair protein RecO (recombination protein O)
MAALSGGDWKLADASEPGVRRECSGLVAAHLQWHLERGLRSLPMVDRTFNEGRTFNDGAPPRGAAATATEPETEA